MNSVDLGATPFAPLSVHLLDLLYALEGQDLDLIVMKLFAFRDEETGKKGMGREPYARKHAIDLYTISALLTVEEYDTLARYRDRYASDPETAQVTREAGEIVAQLFADRASSGALRLQEHSDFPPANQLDDFLGLLAEFFPV